MASVVKIVKRVEGIFCKVNRALSYVDLIQSCDWTKEVTLGINDLTERVISTGLQAAPQGSTSESDIEIVLLWLSKDGNDSNILEVELDQLFESEGIVGDPRALMRLHQISPTLFNDDPVCTRWSLGKDTKDYGFLQFNTGKFQGNIPINILNLGGVSGEITDLGWCPDARVFAGSRIMRK